MRHLDSNKHKPRMKLLPRAARECLWIATDKHATNYNVKSQQGSNEKGSQSNNESVGSMHENPEAPPDTSVDQDGVDFELFEVELVLLRPKILWMKALSFTRSTKERRGEGLEPKSKLVVSKA